MRASIDGTHGRLFAAGTAMLWGGFVVALEIDGTWQRLGDDVLALSAFACAFALLTCLLDAEARDMVERSTARALVLATLASIVLAAAGPRGVTYLVALPALAVTVVALARRALQLTTGKGSMACR